uniref:C-C motif chemokine 19b n=1 Tax=Centroberyx gerrardi TaxID=166262 RepID=UPI003AAEF50F
MSVRLTALLLASVLWYLAAANTDMAVDCCLKTTNKKLSSKLVKSYSVQTPDGGCRIPATVLITQRNIRLCVPPAAGNNWVAKLIKRLQKRELRKVEESVFKSAQLVLRLSVKLAGLGTRGFETGKTPSPLKDLKRKQHSPLAQMTPATLVLQPRSNEPGVYIVMFI